MSRSIRLAVLLFIAVASIPLTVAVTPTVAGAASDDFTLSDDQVSDWRDGCRDSDLQRRYAEGDVVAPGEDPKPRTDPLVFECWRLSKTVVCTESLIFSDLYNCTVTRRVEAETVIVESLLDLGCHPASFYWSDPVLTCTGYTDWTADCYPVSNYFVCMMYRPQGDISDSVVAIYPAWTAGPKPFLPIFW